MNQVAIIIIITVKTKLKQKNYYFLPQEVWTKNL